MTRRARYRLIAWAVALLLAAAVPVKASNPVVGEQGWASWYGPGNGVAMNFCTWTLRHSEGCGSVLIQSHDTGVLVNVPVIDYCLCEVPGSAHPHRIVDLQWGVVDALGLDRAAGMYEVTVWRQGAPAPAALPNTAMEATP